MSAIAEPVAAKGIREKFDETMEYIVSLGFAVEEVEQVSIGGGTYCTVEWEAFRRVFKGRAVERNGRQRVIYDQSCGFFAYGPGPKPESEIVE